MFAASIESMPTTRSITTESVTMATMKFPAQRLLLAGGFAVAIAAAPPAVAMFAAPTFDVAPTAQGCSGGEEPDQFTGVCIPPHTVPNSGSVFTTPAGNPDIPEIDGIPPCTGHNSSVHRPGRGGAVRSGGGPPAGAGVQPQPVDRPPSRGATPASPRVVVCLPNLIPPRSAMSSRSPTALPVRRGASSPHTRTMQRNAGSFCRCSALDLRNSTRNGAGGRSAGRPRERGFRGGGQPAAHRHGTAA